jgi:phosphoglycerate dehydrogenase-like enzyme
MTPTLRILLSAEVRQELAPAIAALLGARRFELVTAPEVLAAPDSAQAGVDLALISRDVTGLSTKHVLADDLKNFYAVLRRSPALQWVHIHSAGADRPIYPELRARGVQVTTSSGANAEVVAQTAIGGLLALARRFPQLMRAQQCRQWAPLVAHAPAPRDLAGQTAVVVGWGPIGQRIAPVLQLLGLNVVVMRFSPVSVAQDSVEMASMADFSSVLPRADWLILACPLTAQTRGLINAERLAALPSGANVINVARGEVVVEADLTASLQSGQLGGAFLDVFEYEPLAADSPLWDLPNVMLTPHSAGHSDGNHGRVCELFLANLARFARGEALHHAVACDSSLMST